MDPGHHIKTSQQVASMGQRGNLGPRASPENGFVEHLHSKSPYPCFLFPDFLLLVQRAPPTNAQDL